MSQDKLPALNEAIVRALAAPAVGSKVHFIDGAARVEGKELPRGFGLRVTAGNVKAWTFDYRDAGRQKRRETIGRWPDWSCVDAAREARRLRQALDKGEAIGKAKAEAVRGEMGATVDSVLDDFLKIYVRKARKLRSADEIERSLDKHVRPIIGAKGVYELKRRDVFDMLQAIEADVQADRVLAYVRKAFNWHATRDDDFTSPIVRGMARVKPSERQRERFLEDDEIYTLWWALKGRAVDFGGDPLPACYPAYVRCLLLTAQRRSEVANMHESELRDTGKGQWVWIIPAGRYKTKREQVVPLSKEVKAELQALRVKPGGKRFVFSTTDGEKPFSGYTKAMTALQMRMAKIRWNEEKPEVEHWTLHDLRRTARTIMSRAGVQSDIAERVLGHVIGGVAGVYDRFAYLDEKREALQKLSDEVESIVRW